VDVLRKYNIEYCCGGKWTLQDVCMMKGLDFEKLSKELENASRRIELSPSLGFESWNVDFLTSYIINVHHQFLKKTLPATAEIVQHFTVGHQKKFPYMQEVNNLVEQLQKEILPHILYEEETIFPYICQVVHAYEDKGSYGRLLVKTLRKPLDVMMRHEEDVLSALVLKIRVLTNDYLIPENACTSHRVALLRLKELDADMVQHIYLENEILFPKAIGIEQELLK
jgi:regulator of cell morphogenesis and NO signaling